MGLVIVVVVAPGLQESASIWFCFLYRPEIGTLWVPGTGFALGEWVRQPWGMYQTEWASSG